MPTYILTWNPDTWKWTDLSNTIARIRRGDSVTQRWSSGNTKKIPVGSRVLLLRQGPEPRGIMASGWTTAPVEELPHWDATRAQRGDMTNYVQFAVDTLLDPETESLLDPRDFPAGGVRDVYWALPASGISIPVSAAVQLEELWASHIGEWSTAGIADAELSALEGEIRYHLVRHRSRERALRSAKIASVGQAPLRCEVPGCGFDFEQCYGDLGKGYVQVHHLRPLASSDESVETSLDDLAIVCANCHAMIHRGGKSRPLGSLIVGSEAPEQPR